MSASVGVVGGGLAGITAALRCADAGRQVTLFESTPRLGGLTYSFRRGDLDVDNGQHVFLRCCTAYQALLDRLGVADRVTLQPRLDIAVHCPTSTRPARLRRSGLPAPLHLSGALARYSPLSPAQRLAFVRAALALRRVDPASPATDEQSFGAWLAAHGQGERAVSALWDLVGVATLNARAADASLALAATVFQIGLLTDTAAADIGWSAVPLSRLHGEPALARLAAAGARVLTGAKVTAVAPKGEGWLIRSREEDHMVDQVVLAVPPDAAERLLPPGSVPLPDGWARGLGSTPIVNAHAVFDRPVMSAPFVAGIDTPIQWVFDRTAQSGLATGQYLAVSLSAADDLVDLPTAVLRERLLPALAALLPRVREAGVTDFFVTRERHATFRPAPGSARLRPGATTAVPGLFLAGAWTATGWPATMEGAVRSGDAAAGALLAEHSPSSRRGKVTTP
ncbi:hydroxysqualene dehydroxylase HpnE [Phytohabitans sp. ZYX-F-186]|uniref:Hydroxysqualene dehydroxylase HpnE n=1 Tax=Phytohabitans maris TaxID=3071409 RepID=A0ABU0ZHK1_9ACTN|nr:hydroxysqualene dehydroxylase HpnE [Phytohabitans sp. ZYX-F-186]MDQ7905765.1 hydroxysqualene dehydroxylase HpnE [Phytohabitans sp. ZYX-F-186]